MLNLINNGIDMYALKDKNNYMNLAQINRFIEKNSSKSYIVRKLPTHWTGLKTLSASEDPIESPAQAYYCLPGNKLNTNFLKLWVKHNSIAFANYYREHTPAYTMLNSINDISFIYKYYTANAINTKNVEYITGTIVKLNNSVIAKQALVGVYDKRRKYIVYLDNGHSQNTPGKHSPLLSKSRTLDLNGATLQSGTPLFEWKWTRLLTDFLQAVLSDLGFSVFKIITEDQRICRIPPSEYTKEEVQPDGSIKETIIKDYDAGDIHLRSERVRALQSFLMGSEQFSNKSVFVSVHCNAAANGNFADSAAGWHAITSKGVNKSDVFARYLYDNMKKYNIDIDKNVNYNLNARKIGSQRDIGVVKACTKYCAAVLTENLFMDARNDLKKLLSTNTFINVVKAHALAIFDYFSDKFIDNNNATINIALSNNYVFNPNASDHFNNFIGNREAFEKELDIAISNRRVGKLNESIEAIIKKDGYNEDNIQQIISSVNYHAINDLYIQDIVKDPSEFIRTPYLGIVI